jgi:hypothetical protein
MPEKRNGDRRLSWTTKEFADKAERSPELITQITREMVDAGELVIGSDVGKAGYKEGSDWHFYMEGMEKIVEKLARRK